MYFTKHYILIIVLSVRRTWQTKSWPSVKRGPRIVRSRQAHCIVQAIDKIDNAVGSAEQCNENVYIFSLWFWR